MNARISLTPLHLIQGGGQKPPDSFLKDYGCARCNNQGEYWSGNGLGHSERFDCGCHWTEWALLPDGGDRRLQFEIRNGYVPEVQGCLE